LRFDEKLKDSGWSYIERIRENLMRS
jgi:hypothetical protein